MRRTFSWLAASAALCIAACLTMELPSSAPPAEASAKYVTIRALNEPVREVILRIAASNHLNVSVDPDVAGYVTCDLHNVEVEAAFKAILLPLGLQFRRAGSVIVISLTPTTQLSVGAPGQQRPQGGPTVLPLSILKANQAARVVRTLFPQASLTVNPASNSLIVNASPSDVQAIQSVVRGIDVQDPSRVTTEGLTLRTNGAGAMATRFQKLFPAASVIATARNTLILKGTPIDLAQMKALAVTLDSPAATPPPVPLSSEVVRIVQRSPRDVGRAIARQVPHIRVAQSGSALIITGAPEEVARAKTLISAIDVPSFDARLTEVFRIKTIDAASVGDLISSSFHDVGVTVNKDLNALSVNGTAAELQRIADAIAQLDGGATPGTAPGIVGGGGDDYVLVPLRSIVPGGGASAQDIANAVTQALQAKAPDLHIIVPSGTSSLLLTGSAYAIREAKRVIETIDVLPQTVALDTEVYEVDENDSKNLGLILPGQSLTTTFSEATPPVTSTGAAQNFIGILPITRTPLSLQVQLNLLVQRGNAHVLANPRITTLSGRTATIRAGDTLGIITTAGGSAGTVATSQIQSFQTGVTLEITPIVTPNGEVNVTLHPTVNSLEAVVNNVPEISTRDAQTSVHLHDNETLVIGGLIQDTTQVTENRVPGLGDLPLVGSLFRNTQKSVTINELIIVVTPHILGLPTPPGTAPTPDPMTIALPTLPPHTPLPPARGKGRQTQAMTQANIPHSSVALTPPPLPTSAPTAPSTPVPTPTAFAQANVFTYGSPPPNTYAGPGDAINIFYATLAPTTVRNGANVVISVITSSNATKVTFGTSTSSVNLVNLGNGKWQASYTFTSIGIDTGQSPIQLPLTAYRSDGVQTTIQIPVSLSK